MTSVESLLQATSNSINYPTAEEIEKSLPVVSSSSDSPTKKSMVRDIQTKVREEQAIADEIFRVRAGAAAIQQDSPTRNRSVLPVERSIW